jgi:hypothetical protein
LSIERDGHIKEPLDGIAALKEWAADKITLFHDAVQP